MANSLAVSIQYILPKHLITIVAGKFANLKAGRFTTAVIRWFVKRYDVKMDEAAIPDIGHYQTFNDFFTRPLKSNARPISTEKLICPVDGAISQLGQIKHDQIFQAKGHEYSAAVLLGGDQELAAQFINGSFATLYLSPKDYHRIHMPCDGTLKNMTYIPGDLFSVNPTTAQGVPRLFARNERLVCEFSGNNSTFVMVLVGATIVGSMATTWHGIVNPPRSKSLRRWEYSDQKIELKKGEEMGRFLLGSTVIVLFPENSCAFNHEWQRTKAIKLGEYMGK